jgi:hypothetical protein
MEYPHIEKQRAKAIRTIADLLLHLTYIEHQLQYKFINGIGDPKETRYLIDQNYNERNELIEDYANLVDHPFNTELINKYINYEVNNEELQDS